MHQDFVNTIITNKHTLSPRLVCIVASKDREGSGQLLRERTHSLMQGNGKEMAKYR